ncbi:MAG: MBL fold metallo-hydrolase [Oscillospiraceae bacterium]|nr:MBL fold metallo-hydrolase [Oscillospiraceae bacterium]
MIQVQVTLSANAGISIQIGKHRIWVDALHEDKQPGFSAVTPDLYQKILLSDAFCSPDYICVTHCHPDHYSETMLNDAKRRWPNAQLCLPGNGAAVGKEDLTLEFIRLPHEGAQYANVLHYGILIRAEGKHILIPGDCETASPVLAEAVGERQIDLAILNFPWVTISKGRAFLTQRLKPKHILLCHLPFEEDDVNGFRTSAKRNVQMLTDSDVRLLSEPLQTQIVNI